MAFGPTLIGAIIGAAAGVGLHQFIEVGLQKEAAWFAVVIGLLTGLGVRQANKSRMGNVSYLRGAITGLIALGAIVGSIQLVSVLASRKGAADAGKPLADAKADPAEDATDEAAEGDAAAEEPVEQPAETAQPVAAKGGGGKMPGPAEPNIMQFIFMAVGAFLAYELGRGSGTTSAVPVGAPVGEPVMTDPSN